MDSIVSGVGVLDKAVTVLGTLESAGRPLSLAELVDGTGLSRPTAHRLAAALAAHGLVGRDGAGRFTLGPRLSALGRAAERSVPLVEVARPVLERLRDETGESTQLYVRSGDRRVCVLSLESPHGLRTIVPVGAALPLDKGSAGRALTAAADAAGGWVASVAEREPGVASVAAPVHGPDGSIVAAVSVSGPVDRTSRTPGRRYGAAVARATAAIQAELA